MSEENESQKETKLLEEGEKDNHEETKGDKPARKSRSDFYIELILFLVLGILVGVSLKTEAAKKLTVGYNDYKMKIMNQDYDINQLQKDLLKKSQEEANQQPDAESAGAVSN